MTWIHVHNTVECPELKLRPECFKWSLDMSTQRPCFFIMSMSSLWLTLKEEHVTIKTTRYKLLEQS